MRARRAAAGALACLVLLVSGCVYYPTVMDVGGIRMEPRAGRAVRDAGGAQFYVDIHSTGKFGDVLERVETAVARRTALVSGAGAPLARLEIPGETVVRFTPDGHHVVLGDLTRELRRGEVIIVTLFFAKFGAIGVVTPVE
jgi:copper(I)-binding protein